MSVFAGYFLMYTGYSPMHTLLLSPECPLAWDGGSIQQGRVARGGHVITPRVALRASLTAVKSYSVLSLS